MKALELIDTERFSTLLHLIHGLFTELGYDKHDRRWSVSYLSHTAMQCFDRTYRDGDNLLDFLKNAFKENAFQQMLDEIVSKSQQDDNLRSYQHADGMRLATEEDRRLFVHCVLWQDDDTLTAYCLFSRPTDRDLFGNKLLSEFHSPLHALLRHNYQVRESERKAIAREIHDEMGQLLTVTKMDIRMLEQKLQRLAPETLPELKTIRFQLEEAVSVSRDVIAKLRPPALDLGLMPAIEWLANEFQKRGGAEMSLHHNVEDWCLDENTSIHLFRIIQETLNNVSKYAEASKVKINVHQDDSTLRLTVQDNGKGFNPDTIKFGYGLLGIKERASLIGAHMQIQAALGEGVKLDIELPLVKTS